MSVDLKNAIATQLANNITKAIKPANVRQVLNMAADEIDAAALTLTDIAAAGIRSAASSFTNANALQLGSYSNFAGTDAQSVTANLPTLATSSNTHVRSWQVNTFGTSARTFQVAGEILGSGTVPGRMFRRVKQESTWSSWIELVDVNTAQTLLNKILQGAVATADPVLPLGLATKQYAVSRTSDDALTGGYTTTAVNDGTRSSGTYTPSPSGSNLKRAVNGGAHSLAAPAVAGDYTIIIQYTNSASAGAITFVNFNKVVGDSITVTNGHRFFIYITKINNVVGASVIALQ